MNVLVVGNGATGNQNDESFFINNHTGEFLVKINEIHNVNFVQYSSVFNFNNDLQNFDLKSNNIGFELVNGNKNLNTYRKLYKLVRRSDFIYIFFPGTLGRIVGIISILLGKKIGLYVRGENYNKSGLDKLILKKSKFILTVSEHFVSELERFCSNVELIKPMISLDRNDINIRKYTFNQPWRFLFVGRIEKSKGIYNLLQIGRELAIKGLNFTIDIVGGGVEFNEIRTIIAKEKLKNINLLGQISDKVSLTDLYNNSDAFIFTSHHEGFPRVLYEAMASGLPIFTTFVGGIPGRMKDHFNCIEIPLKDGVASASVILDSIENKTLLTSIAQHGQKTLIEILDGKYKEHNELLLKNINAYD